MLINKNKKEVKMREKMEVIDGVSRIGWNMVIKSRFGQCIELKE